ncbi:MAG: hypothetical protein APF76_16835 [Desulfitibacter sp. BRH_c19]|nr:MAG: hypothetical protein APF76_16835 [Desulfitibacter sp. BRH_c19]
MIKRNSILSVCRIFIYSFLCLALVVPGSAFADTISLTIEPTRGYAGDSVIASGTAGHSEWVTIKGLDGEGSIVYLNSIMSDENGNYSDTFRIPDIPPGELRLIAGYGSNIITELFTVAASRSGGGGGRNVAHTYKAVVSRNSKPETNLPVNVNSDKDRATVNLETLTGDIFTGKERTTVIVPSIHGVTSYTLGIPADTMSRSQREGALTFSTDPGSITIGDNMLSGISETEGKETCITIGEGNKSHLPDEIKAAIGERPLVQLTLTVDGEQTQWNNPEAPVMVAIPYIPTEEELKDPEHITIWYIDGEGNVVEVPSGRYDPATGLVTFTTTHFSKYAVVYVTKTFEDLESVAWAEKQIEVLASKGILKGTLEKEYAPQTNITRADFLYFFVRTLGVDAKVDENFDDISEDAYYYKEIAIAKKLGITNGIGNNKFNPNESITRQDMMTLTERALRMLKKLEQQGTASDLEKFVDQSSIAAYAVDSVASVVKEGLIVGSADKINPLGNTTRAETAVFLYRIYNK